jgi:hypothetical protein
MLASVSPMSVRRANLRRRETCFRALFGIAAARLFLPKESPFRRCKLGTVVAARE